MEQEKTNKTLIPLSIVIAGILVAAAIYFGASTETPSRTVTTDTAQDEIEVAPVTEKDHIRGSINEAEIVIIEYSDTECPFCKIFHGTMKEILNIYGAKVAWVYRQFPIVQLHSLAPKESEATECAADIGGNQVFWNYLDKIFETTNSNNSLNPAELPKIALEIGLDKTSFETCLASGKYTEFINESVEKAIKTGARGTPYSVIVTKDGVQDIINGAQPLETVRLQLDSLLK